VTTQFIEWHLKVGTAEGASKQPDKAKPTAAPTGEARRFRRTRVIGYSQVGSPRGGWFVAGGVFESIVGWRHPDSPVVGGPGG
jgi:hypothetical protein